MESLNTNSRKEIRFREKTKQCSLLKEIRLHPNTDVHDFEFKLKHAQNFVQEGNKVKVCVMFKGREMAYTDQGETLLNRFIERTEDIAKVESPIKMEGRNMNIILVPASKKHKEIIIRIYICQK